MHQKVEIIGNLGQDPEMRYMPDGTAVTNFSVATNRKWTDKASGELVQETTWFRVSVWGAQAEACNQYLKKGRLVYVEGRLRPDQNTGGPRTFTRQDGTVGATYEIQSHQVVFLGGRDDTDAEPERSSGTRYERGRTEPEEDEIPF